MVWCEEVRERGDHLSCETVRLKKIMKNIKNNPPIKCTHNGLKRYGSVCALDAQGEGSTPSSPTIYKSIMLPSKLQEKIKLLAVKNKQTIIQFIEELLSNFNL